MIAHQLILYPRLAAGGVEGILDEFFSLRIFKKVFPEIFLEAARNTIVFTTIAFIGGFHLVCS